MFCKDISKMLFLKGLVLNEHKKATKTWTWSTSSIFYIDNGTYCSHTVFVIKCNKNLKRILYLDKRNTHNIYVYLFWNRSFWILQYHF